MKRVLKHLERNEKTSLMNIRVTKAEREKIVKKAEAFTRGNISDWLRYAGAHHEPRKEHLVEA